MKSRKAFYDYYRRYHNGKFLGWEVAKIHRVQGMDESIKLMAIFYGKKAKTHAKEFTAKLNIGTII